MSFKDRIKGLRRVRARDLRHNPANPSLHTEEQRSALRAVLEKIGYIGAAIARRTADGTLELIDGHLRADLDPDQKIPVLVVDIDDTELAIALATYNPLAAMAGRDADKLDALVSKLATDCDLSAALAALGVHREAAPTGPAAVEDAATPEPPARPITQPGDLWLLGRHRVLCGDATDQANARRVCAGETPLIMVTDPPYGVEYDASWRHDCGLNNSAQVGVVKNDDRASWAAAFTHFHGDVAYVWHGGLHAATVVRSLEVAGFELRAQVVWVKSRFAISRGHYHWRHEPCWYAVRKGGKAKWSAGRKQQTVWADIVDKYAPRRDLFAARVDDETLYAFEGAMTTVWHIAHDKACGGGHSTQKPVECMARPLRHHGGPRDAVYDPFLGSGTTLIAAEQLGRACLGLELDPGYCDVIVRRWESLTGQQAERESCRRVDRKRNAPPRSVRASRAASRPSRRISTR